MVNGEVAGFKGAKSAKDAKFCEFCFGVLKRVYRSGGGFGGSPIGVMGAGRGCLSPSGWFRFMIGGLEIVCGDAGR
jgi:hypothetical protein